MYPIEGILSMNIRPFALISILISVIFLGACSSKFPDHDILEDDLEKGMNWRPLADSLPVNSVIELVSFQIRNTSISCNEKCESILEFRGKVRTIDTFFYSSQYKGVYHEIPEWGLGNKQAWKRANRGQFLDFSGKAYYDLFDTGWKIRQFDAPVLDSRKEKVVKFYIPKIVLKEEQSLF
jgi:hypothetical protein